MEKQIQMNSLGSGRWWASGTSGLSSRLARVWWSSAHWEPGWGSPVLTRFLGPVPDDLRVNCARHTVVELGIQLGQLVAGVDQSL